MNRTEAVRGTLRNRREPCEGSRPVPPPAFRPSPHGSHTSPRRCPRFHTVSQGSRTFSHNASHGSPHGSIAVCPAVALPSSQPPPHTQFYPVPHAPQRGSPRRPRAPHRPRKMSSRVSHTLPTRSAHTIPRASYGPTKRLTALHLHPRLLARFLAPSSHRPSLVSHEAPHTGARPALHGPLTRVHTLSHAVPRNSSHG